MNLYYIQTNIICMLILLIVNLALRNKKSTMPARRLAFSRLLSITAVICLSDMVAWYFLGKPGKRVQGVLHVSNMVYDAAITWVGYAWLQYVELRTHSLEDSFRKQKTVTRIPLFVMLAVLLINPWTGFLYTISEANEYSRASGIYLHWVISWGYLVYALVLVLRSIRRASSRAERDQLVPMIWFIVPPAAAAVLQMFFYGLTSTQCGITLSILIIAVNYLRDEISKDGLTGLNNRRALENYLTELLPHSNQELTVFMCDVDKFKQINDTLGHTAGDLVLKRMSGVLKQVCRGARRSMFLCRYGGDEFVICGNGVDEEGKAALVRDLEEAIGNLNHTMGDELNFGISVGHASGNCASYTDVEALLAQADEAMYHIKKAKKAARE